MSLNEFSAELMLHVSNKLSNKTWPKEGTKNIHRGLLEHVPTAPESLHFLRLMARFASRRPTQKPQIWQEVVFKTRWFFYAKAGEAWKVSSQETKKSNFWCIPHFWANPGKQSRNATFEALRWVRNPYSFRSVSRPILTLWFLLVSSILQPQTILLEREKNIRIIRKTKKPGFVRNEVSQQWEDHFPY